MKIVKVIGYCAAAIAVLTLTGYDCPECNYKAQTIVLAVFTGIAFICGVIIAKKEKKL